MSQTQTEQSSGDNTVDSGYESLPATPQHRMATATLPALGSSTVALPPPPPPPPPSTSDSHPDSRDIICGMRRYDKDICEEIQKRFQDILNRLAEPLTAYLRKSRKEYRPTAVRLIPLGHDENSVQPWIVVLCPAHVKKRAEKFFKKDLALRLCRPNEPDIHNFHVVVVGHAPQMKGFERPNRMQVGRPGNRFGEDTLWSRQIKVDYCGTSRFATMGGYILVVDKQSNRSVYGLTVNHVISHVDPEKEASDKRSNEESNSPLDDSSSESDDENVEEESPISSAIVAKEDVDIYGAELGWVEIGHLAPSTFSRNARNGDWALIEGLEFGNTSESPLFWNHGEPYRNFCLKEIQDGESVVIGFPETSGYHYKAFGARSMVILPSGDEFVWVHNLRPPLGDTRSLPSGLSGSWVTRTSKDISFNVYGHVVAEDLFKDIYMVSLTGILDSISSELGLAARLPYNTLEISKLLRQQAYQDDEKLLINPGYESNTIPQLDYTSDRGLELPAFGSSVPDEVLEKSTLPSFSARKRAMEVSEVLKEYERERDMRQSRDGG